MTKLIWAFGDYANARTITANFNFVRDIELSVLYVEIKCQLGATEVFIADLIACSKCFGHHYAHHQELKNIMCPVCRMLQHPANRTHKPQLHTRPAT